MTPPPPKKKSGEGWEVKGDFGTSCPHWWISICWVFFLYLLFGSQVVHRMCQWFHCTLYVVQLAAVVLRACVSPFQWTHVTDTIQSVTKNEKKKCFNHWVLARCGWKWIHFSIAYVHLACENSRLTSGGFQSTLTFQGGAADGQYTSYSLEVEKLGEERQTHPISCSFWLSCCCMLINVFTSCRLMVLSWVNMLLILLWSDTASVCREFTWTVSSPVFAWSWL